MMLARGRHILIGLIALSTVVAGVGYSAFSFRETAEDSTSADPSPDNIRENFIFGNDSDSNVLTTKYYTVNFYAQYLGYNDGNSLNLAGDGSDHYDCDVAGGPLLSNGYSHYLGFFKEGSFDADKIESLGGEVAYLKDATPANELENDNGYANCITFHNVSAITQEMLQAIRCPVFTDDDLSKDGNNMSNGLVDNSGWVLKFISWALVPSTGGPNLYSNLKVYPQGPNKFQVDGSYPTSGFTVPNFNLSLSHYDGFKMTNSEGKNVINVFPLLSTGKNYASADTKDAIALQIPKEEKEVEGNKTYVNKDIGADYLSTDFAYDPIMCLDTNGDGKTDIDAYRFPGLTINDIDKFKTVYIGIDIDRTGGPDDRWEGTYMPLAMNDLYTNFDNHNTVNSDNALDLSSESLGLEEGRYNFYLFVKKTPYSNGSISGLSENNDYESVFRYIVNNTDEIVETDIDEINEQLEINKIHSFAEYDLGTSFIYSGLNFSWDGGWEGLFDPTYRATFGYYSRDFYLVVEKTFDLKLMGSESETWDYGKAPLSPGFNQMVEESEGSLTILDEYEVRDVTMDGNKYTTFSQDGLGKLILPQTFFGIGIDSNSSSFDLDTVDLAYETSSVTSEVKPIGQIVNGSVVPGVEVPSVETLSFLKK